jgi:hypothetical protein
VVGASTRCRLGQLHLRNASSDAGSEWIDDRSPAREAATQAPGRGRRPDHVGLSEQTKLLRDHLANFDPLPGGRPYSGARKLTSPLENAATVKLNLTPASGTPTHRTHLRRDPPPHQGHRPTPRRDQLPHPGVGRAVPGLGLAGAASQ